MTEASAGLAPSPSLRWRNRKSAMFRLVCASLTFACVGILCWLLFDILKSGVGWVDLYFLSHMGSSYPEQAGVKGCLIGSLYLVALTALISVPLGVAAAVYLEEYAPKGKLSTFIEINVSNLAGVPSIVYGILGIAVFVHWLALGTSLITGALTMSLVVLPVVIIASREAIRAVPRSMRQAAAALGATKWQTVRHHVLPYALPGITTGVILSISRAIGETAPLVLVGASLYVNYLPTGLRDGYAILPLQIYSWSAFPQEAFQQLAAAAIIVLLALLLTLNSIAVFIRIKFQRKFQ